MKMKKKSWENWNNYSPESLSIGAQTKVLEGAYFFDLDKGDPAVNRNKQHDIYWGAGADFTEYLRAENGITWFDRGVVNFDKIKYRQIQDAKYSSPRHVKSNNLDLFNARRNVAPSNGHAFFVKTTKGNVAKIQITGFFSPHNNIQLPRSIGIKYEVFPVVKDPPKPKR